MSESSLLDMGLHDVKTRMDKNVNDDVCLSQMYQMYNS